MKDDEFSDRTDGEEADWRACGDGGWNVDRSGAGRGGGGEYVSDFFFEPAAVASGGSEA